MARQDKTRYHIVSQIMTPADTDRASSTLSYLQTNDEHVCVCYLYIVQCSTHHVQTFEEIVTKDIFCLWCHFVFKSNSLDYIEEIKGGRESVGESTDERVKDSGLDTEIGRASCRERV